ncbi:outer membrane protein assembly factor BamB family protein [Mucilaginibacter glaciei]|uniref:PQQ-binding-like beta-propeller repeat protein n=1 Tax=Mucilaginibacter glaciei TaxID=2772109 RepID=A0A926NQG9_9SPHI|nr:PQQ-binding-like beta-propeller repeat protein [Mucilaginibacter glaciei]MBD1392797.1 PQQ-binding-like beta-propeller repeat protein [Mucilaginibacter glaciei]
MRLISLLVAALAVCILFDSCKQREAKIESGYKGWTTYAGSKDGARYSTSEVITLANVANLKQAWVYSSNDKDTAGRTQNQCNPIMIDGMLYGSTPKLKLFSLNAATGKQNWLFDPASVDTVGRNQPMAYYKVNRGVVYWQDADGNNRRVFYNVGSKVYCIDVVNGKPVSNFGDGGYLDMTENVGREIHSFVASTTPGIIYKDVLIMGVRVAESEDAAPAPIRAYDALTGKLLWSFNTIPHPGEKGYETWENKDAWKHLGGANNWAGMSLDERRGIVYIPTGSIGGDFYGGNRKGQNLYANSLIALNAATGKYIWHFQFVHHDLWDRDLPANPNLVTIVHNGKMVDIVAQITKHGYIFMFDRVTGVPIFPINEKGVPTNGLPGEQPWPTQPIPSLPKPFARQKFAPEDVTDLSPETNKDMMEKYLRVKNRVMFAPPSKEGGWIFPGFDGGGEWGGAAVDQQTKIMYINSSELPWAQVMIDVPKTNSNDHSLAGAGSAIYNQRCIACHGADLKGNGFTIPSLVKLEKKYNELQVKSIIDNGRNMMPSFKALPDGEKKALLTFLLKIPEKEAVGPTVRVGAQPAEKPDQAGLLQAPYTMAGYNRFVDKDGYPGIKPPWGTLNAVDLTSGKLLWKVPLGEFAALTKKGIPITGTENYGGPLVTKGGLVFIAATKDEKIRAFDKKTGKVVWEAKLPAAGYATPACYEIDGRQYIVIACGGGKIGSPSGDSYVAFSF